MIFRYLLCTCTFISTGIVSIVLSTSAFADSIPKIGVILPLTGDLAQIGTEIKHGIELAAKETTQTLISLKYEDDRSFDKLASLAAATKLTQSDKVDLLLNGGINTMRAIDALLRRVKTPAIILWDNNRSLKNFAPSVFSIGYSTEGAGEDMAEFVGKKLGIKTIGIISAEDEWSEVIASAFVSRAKERNLSISFHEQVAPSDSDFKALLTRTISLRPDAIYLPVNPPAIDTLIRRLRELKYKGFILTADGFGENEINELGEDAEGIYATQILVHNDELRSKYIQEFGSNVSPINLGFVALGYDGFKLALKLVETARAKNASIAEIASQFSHDGYTGHSVLTKSDKDKKHETVSQVRYGVLQEVKN